jgi:putative phage-type endonuclease
MNTYLCEMINEIIVKNPQFIVNPNYEDLLFKQLIINDLFKNYDKQQFMNEIKDILKHINKERCSNSYEYSNLDINESTKTQLHILQNTPQPMQKTPEWYTFRHEHITASNAWKAFGTQAVKNQLIYEKCKALQSATNETMMDTSDNEMIPVYKTSTSNLSESSLTWGHKYEPLTRMLYEDKHKTIIQDFGCIEHPIHTFLAASPDGIVVGENNYGRMIEIKNVVSREINQIPKIDYYIQTQLQMEVCNLDECDFIETKFIEYENYNDYIQDNTDDKKGIIVVYVNNGAYEYYYMPFHIKDETEINEWLDNNMNNSGEWIKNVYWKLSVYSCVLIKRQREWFTYAIPHLIEIWNTILVERTGDYSDRAPRKRNKITNNINI